MPSGLINKLTNFLMPVEETFVTDDSMIKEKKSHLRLQHAQHNMKIYVGSPLGFDDVKMFADYLKLNTTVIINFEAVDERVQQRINDFLSGLCFVTGGSAERVSEHIYVYVPCNVEVNKELYSFAMPAYNKR